MIGETDNHAVALDTAKRMAITGHAEDAARVLRDILQVNPLMVEARYLLGVTYIAVGDNRAARAEMKRCAIYSPGSVNPWKQLGKLSSRDRRQPDAMRYLWRAHGCSPSDDKILEDLLALSCQIGKVPPGKLMDWRRRLFSMGNQRVFRLYIDLLMKSGATLFQWADQVFRVAIIDQPSNVRLLGYMGREQTSPWSPKQRQIFRLRQLKLGVMSADVLQNIGLFCKASEQFGLAEAYIKRGILVSPTRTDPYYRLFFLKRNQGAQDEARTYLRRRWCCRHDPENHGETETLLRRSAELERESGDTGSLIPEIKKVLARPGLNWEARSGLARELARCQIEAGDTAGSLENLTALERRRPNGPSTYLLADWSSHYYRSGERRAYDRLVDRDFIQSYDIAAPDPRLDIPKFNAALRHCVTRHPSLTLQGDGGMGDYRQTGDRGPGSLLEDQTPEIVCLRRYFELALLKYRETLPDDPDHPFLKFKNVPAPISVFWGLVNRNNKDIATHRHGDATFVTGIYYAHEAGDVEDPANPRSGWFEALRSDLNIKMAREDILEFETRPGRFLFLPGYYFHRAMPTRLSKKRVSIVADFNFAPE